MRSYFLIYIKLLAKIRKRNRSYIGFYVIGMCFCAFYFAGSFIKPVTSPDTPHPDVRTIPDSRDVMRRLGNVFWATPPSDFAKHALDFLPDGNVRWVNEQTDIVNALQSLNDTEIGTGIVFAKNDTGCDLKILTARMSENTPIYAITTQLLLDNSTQLSLSQRPFAHPETSSLIGVQTNSIMYFCLAFIFIGSKGLQFLVSLSEKKVEFMMKVMGMSEVGRNLAAFVIHIVELAPLIFIATGAVMSVETSQGTNPALFALSYALTILTFTFMSLGFSYVLRNAKQVGGFLVVCLVLCTVSLMLLVFQMSIPKSVMYVCYTIIPFQPFYGFMDLIFQQSSLGEPLGFGNLDSSVLVSGSALLLWHVEQVVVWFLFYIVMALCCKRVFGKAPLGWRNLLRCAKWRQILKRGRRFCLLDYSNDDVALSMRNVSRTYNGKVKTLALNDFSVDIPTGGMVIVIGPNGAGKSTLINALVGAIDIDSGSIAVFGQEIEQDFSVLYANLGIVFQDNVLIDELTCDEYLRLWCDLQGESSVQASSDISYFCSLLGIGDCLAKQSNSLSGGQKRKLAIALALIRKPAILILDEPTAGVDVQARQCIWKAICSVDGLTCLISAHSLEEAENIASGILVMKKGEKAFYGTAAELRNQYQCGYKITILDDGVDMAAILAATREVVPEATIVEDHPKTIIVPADLRATDVLERLEQAKQPLGFSSYTVHLENLEETLRNIIEDEEAETKHN